MRRLGLLARLGTFSAAAGCGLAALLGACGQGTGYVGPMVRLSGNFNNWAKGDTAPTLQWDGSAYRGVALLPGDALQFQIYGPYTGALIGGAGDVGAIPVTLDTSHEAKAEPVLQLDTPLPARYAVVFDPAQNQLHVDFADDAEKDFSDLAPKDTSAAGAVQLIAALRGSDQASAAMRTQRADAFMKAITNPDSPIETPLVVGQGAMQGLTFLRLGPVDYPALSLVGDFNGWTEDRDPMHFVLDGRVAYRARRGSGVRLEYRFALHGLRYEDRQNPEVVWDGAYLPPNLHNLLGGNVGNFNSVALTPGAIEQGSRLRRITLPYAPPMQQPMQRDVYVYLPPGYADDAKKDTAYPTLYVFDGKDAIVRGRYNQTLDRLIAAQKLPRLLAVFVPSESDTTERLAEYANFPDGYFGDVQAQGDDFEGFVLATLLPAVERQYRAQQQPDQRAVLGIDLAGAFAYHLAWTDKDAHFLRVASQSGRFGWGDPQDPPYLRLLSDNPDRGKLMKWLSFDWASGDQFQVTTAHEAKDHSVKKIFAGPDYAGRVVFNKQDTTLPMSTPWDNWRSRLDAALLFLFQDLLIH